MSSKTQPFKIKEVHFLCSAHATEDIEKVKQAILNLIPERLREAVEIQDTEMTGHAENPIHLMELYVSKNRDINDTLTFLSSKIAEYDKETLTQQAENRIDKANCFYFRVNKQEALNETILLEEEENTIRIMIKYIIYKQEPNLIRKSLEGYGLLLQG